MKLLETIFLCSCILTLLAMAVGQVVPVLAESCAAVHIFCSYILAVLGLVISIDLKRRP